MGIYIPNMDKPKFCDDCFVPLSKCEYFAKNGIDHCPLIEIVRCGECKWWTKQADSIQGRCELLKMYPSSAWYCGNGERRAE